MLAAQLVVRRQTFDRQLLVGLVLICAVVALDARNGANFRAGQLLRRLVSGASERALLAERHSARSAELGQGARGGQQRQPFALERAQL